MSNQHQPMPREEKWDHSVENIIRKTSLGFIVGLLPSILLTRSLASRLGVVLFATGFGAGVGYAEARYLFDHNIMFDKRNLITVQLFQPSKDNGEQEK